MVTHISFIFRCCVVIYIYIYIYYCGAKGSGDSGPFNIKPKAHAGEDEVLEDE